MRNISTEVRCGCILMRERRRVYRNHLNVWRQMRTVEYRTLYSWMIMHANTRLCVAIVECHKSPALWGVAERLLRRFLCTPNPFAQHAAMQLTCPPSLVQG